MSDVLAKICDVKREHVRQQKRRRPMSDLLEQAKAAKPPRGFSVMLHDAVATGDYGLIAEIKRASPSKGLIREDFQPVHLARAYERGGATCLSILTDVPFFQGADEFLVAARTAVNLPALRKDFMLDPYQVVESRALGADCILLIMAALDDAQARELESVARQFDLDVLVEVHDEAELERALQLKARLIGVNNRNLKTMEVTLKTTERLAPMVPTDRLLVAESGIHKPDDLARLEQVGASCFLVGESLMRQDDVEAATRELLTRPLKPSSQAQTA